MTIDRSAAAALIRAEGRVLEQHVHAALFEGAGPDRVVQAVLAFQNPDGGFGHGLEPDKRCPASQPLDVEIALERLVWVGAGGDHRARAAVEGACEFLASIADPCGAVPVLLPSIAGYPRAEHWSFTDQYPPAVNPSASIAAYATALHVTHPWVDKATDWCFATVEAEGAPPEAHSLLCLTRLVEHAGDRRRAATLAGAIATALPAAEWYLAMPKPGTYGVTPLDFAPAPDHPARSWFDDATIDANLDALEAQQEADGAWPVTWEPPTVASRCEWRAIRTLQALRILTAYGR